MNSPRSIIAAGAILGLLAVAMGAFGAHALKPHLGEGMMEVYRTAAQYHATHGLALVLSGLVYTHFPGRLVRASAWAFLLGTLLFSGSLYLLAITGSGWLGMVTPIGGLSLLLAWAILAWSMITHND